jgi:WhiB family redox-sensing transcriptional regulator
LKAEAETWLGDRVHNLESLPLASASLAKVHLVVGEVQMYGPPLKGGMPVSAQRVEEAWQVRAACRGPQAVVFFPPSHFERKSDKLQREEQAKAICASCAVREPCLQYALRIREPHGIWGGLSEADRRAMVAVHN